MLIIIVLVDELYNEIMGEDIEYKLRHAKKISEMLERSIIELYTI